MSTVAQEWHSRRSWHHTKASSISKTPAIGFTRDALICKKDGARTYLGIDAVREWKEKGAVHCRFIEDHYFEIPCPHCEGSGVACNFEPEFPEVVKQ
jgi:hypothetical protein